jgi:hypothetical protein
MRPLNLVARFLLEIAALVALGYWGYQMAEGGLRYVVAAGIPTVGGCRVGHLCRSGRSQPVGKSAGTGQWKSSA